MQLRLTKEKEIFYMLLLVPTLHCFADKIILSNRDMTSLRDRKKRQTSLRVTDSRDRNLLFDQ